MSYQSRIYRHRNPKGIDKKKAGGPFFKELPGVQRLATSKEDEKLATNDARMEKDKEDPLKPVQKKENPGEKGPEKEMPHKNAIEPGKDKKKKPVQKKEATATSHAEAGIKDQTGKGNPLPPKLLAEMSKSFGVDFSNVRIHHDAAASKLCRELNAMAFTHGQDIFFNDGKFNPETKEGKLLLAHELTHVVQQANSTEL